MIVVVLLFLLGGNVYTLLCRPWNNGQLLKVVIYGNTYYKDVIDAVLDIFAFNLLPVLSTVY